MPEMNTGLRNVLLALALLSLVVFVVEQVEKWNHKDAKHETDTKATEVQAESVFVYKIAYGRNATSITISGKGGTYVIGCDAEALVCGGIRPNDEYLLITAKTTKPRTLQSITKNIGEYPNRQNVALIGTFIVNGEDHKDVYAIYYVESWAASTN